VIGVGRPIKATQWERMRERELAGTRAVDREAGKLKRNVKLFDVERVCE